MRTTIAAVRPQQAESSRDGRVYRPDIEGLRAVAVALVVLCQAGVPGLAGGFIGIDVFFVISGFLLTSLLVREVDATGVLSLTAFYGRRVRRLLPASCLVLLATVAAAYYWLGPARAVTVARDGAWSALFAANLRNAPSPLQHYWALAVQEQFSIVWPALIALLLWLGLRHALPLVLTFLTAGSFAYAIAFPASLPAFSRAWEFGAGCLLALAGRHLGRIPARLGVALAGLGLAIIVTAALSFKTPLFVYAAILPVTGAALVLAGRGDALLAAPPLRLLGRLSFALYLWHWPISAIAAEAYGPLTPAARALVVLAALILAVLTYFGLEAPIRRSDRLRHSPVLTFALAFLLIVLPLVVARYTLATAVAHVQP